MLKYLTHKLRTHTINDEQTQAAAEGRDLDNKNSASCPSDGELDNNGESHNCNSSSGSNKFRHRKSEKEEDCNDPLPNIEIQIEEDIDSELHFPMSDHGDARTPDYVDKAKTMYEQNNSSEEELEVIINGTLQVPFSRTPDEFSDTGDEEGVVYEISAVPEPVKLCAVNVTEDQLAPDNGANLEEDDGDCDGDEDDPRESASLEAVATFRRPSTAEKRKRPIDHDEETIPPSSMFDLLPRPPLNFCTSPPLEALKPHRSHSTTHILMHHNHVHNDDTENMMMMVEGEGGGAGSSSGSTGPGDGDKNQSTNRRLSGPINSSAKHLYVNNCPGFKPTAAAVVRRSFRPSDSLTSGGGNGHHNERWTMLGTEGEAIGDDGDSEVERFNFESIQISHSSPSLPVLDMRSVSPPAAKLFHCEAAVATTATSVSPKRRPLKHHNHQRLQRLQRPCLDFDKMQQLKTRPVTSWRHNNEGEMSVFCW